MSTTYEKAIAQHDDLTTLLKDNEVFHSTSLDDFVAPDEEFREWITPKYVASFKACSAQALDKKIIWKLTRLASLKSPCTAEGISQCNDIIAAIAHGHLKGARDFKDNLVGGNLSIASDANYIFTSPWTNTFNKLSSNYENLKEDYAQLGYDVAMYFKTYGKDANYLATIKAIKNANCSFELKGKIKPHADDLKAIEEIVSEHQSGGGPSVWSIIIGVVIVIRLIMLLVRLAQ